MSRLFFCSRVFLFEPSSHEAWTWWNCQTIFTLPIFILSRTIHLVGDHLVSRHLHLVAGSFSVFTNLLAALRNSSRHFSFAFFSFLSRFSSPRRSRWDASLSSRYSRTTTFVYTGYSSFPPSQSITPKVDISLRKLTWKTCGSIQTYEHRLFLNFEYTEIERDLWNVPQRPEPKCTLTAARSRLRPRAP